ncbi:hypothetical protein J6P68_05625 [bacterium]|nr:hypothetical protein [bacterium]
MSTTNSKNTNNNSSISQDIASKLGSLIKNPIPLANGYNLTAEQSIETSSNQQTLSTAIKEAISDEINSTTITINDKVYQVSKLISNINITLPDQVSNQNNNSGILENITLSYNGYNIENASNSNLYEVTNFAIPSSKDQDNQNNAVATYLNSLLNQIIQLDNPTYSQDYANQALILNPVSLKKAIINAIGLEITNQISDSPINNIYYSISDIKQNLNVTLPTNISENDEKNGQISNVNLYYKNIELSNTSNTNNFIVQGFKTTTLQNILNQPTSSTTTGSNQNNKTIKSNIISQLNSELNQYINVAGYSNTTATSALSNENNLDNAIISSLQKEISSFTFNNIVFDPQDIFNTNTLTIKIPSSNAIIDNGQEISNVTIYFENSQLSNTQGQYFIVGSFKEETSDGTSVSQQIANKLDSLLSNIINVAQYYSMDTYTAAEALNNQATDSLTNAIISAIKYELGSNSIEIDNNSYSINNIANELKVSLPSTISLTDDENAQIPGVTLSYDNISLT